MNYEKLVEQHKKHEGLELTPYQCTGGYWTVGFGRNLEDKGMTEDEQNAWFGCVYEMPQLLEALQEKPLTADFAEQMLIDDIGEAEAEAGKAIKLEKYSGPRQAVIINMVFNLGLPRFQKFKKVFAALKIHDYDTAAQEMKDSLWYKQVGNRAIELCEQMKSGEWQL